MNGSGSTDPDATGRTLWTILVWQAVAVDRLLHRDAVYLATYS